MTTVICPRTPATIHQGMANWRHAWRHARGRTWAVAVVAALCAAMLLQPQPCTGLPAGFAETQMLFADPKLGLVMQMVHLPDGRALLLSKAGTMWIAEPSKKGFPYQECVLVGPLLALSCLRTRYCCLSHRRRLQTSHHPSPAPTCADTRAHKRKRAQTVMRAEPLAVPRAMAWLGPESPCSPLPASCPPCSLRRVPVPTRALGMSRAVRVFARNACVTCTPCACTRPYVPATLPPQVHDFRQRPRL